MEEEAPVVELELDDEPIVELDLDDPAEPMPDAPEQERGVAALLGRVRPALPAVAIGVAGALLGGGLVHVVDTARDRGDTTVTVALGESGGRLLNRRWGNMRVVLLSTVALNAGASALTVRGVRVQGDGARLTRTYRGEATIYPIRLEPGATANMPLAVAADCDVRALTPPRVTVDVTAEDGTQRAVDVRIPGLDELWRRATTPEACSGT